jgi:NAD-dependent SIR2 family protein deacetylase
MTSIDRVASLLTPDARVTVLTGAGVSAASGVPTFRGAGGLCKSFRAEDLARPQAFARDPATVWEWYDWRPAIVYRAAGLLDIARSHGATAVEINPDATAASAHVDVVVAVGAEQALPAVDDILIRSVDISTSR